MCNIVLLEQYYCDTGLVCNCVCLMFAHLRQKQTVPFFFLIFSLASFCSHSPSLFPAHPTKQARRELRRLKEEARRKHAVAVIWAYWKGLKVPTSPPVQPIPISDTYPSPLTLFILLNNLLNTCFYRKPVSAWCCGDTLSIKEIAVSQ